MHYLDIIEINECLVLKNLLMNITKTNEISNVKTVVCAIAATRKVTIHFMNHNVYTFRRQWLEYKKLFTYYIVTQQ